MPAQSLDAAESRLKEREEELSRLRSELEDERGKIHSLETEIASLRARVEQQAAEIEENVYYEELARRLEEAYSLLTGIEEAYFAARD